MLSLDLGPLRRSPAFRRLFVARACSLLIYGALATTIYLQLATLSSAATHVAAVSVIMAFALALSLLVGGHLADRMDRRRLILFSRTAYLGAVVILIGNALAVQPHIWPIYLAGLIGGITSGISIPAFMAVTPSLLDKEDLPAAAALGAMTVQVGAVLGPTLASLLIAAGGFAASYALVAVGATLTVIVLHGLPELPPPRRRQDVTPSRRGEALSFVLRHRLMGRLMLVDLLATACVTPFALLPQLGEERLGMSIGGTGLLFSAFAAGAFLAGMLTDSRRSVLRPMLPVALAAVVYGTAAIALGTAAGPAQAMAALAVMGCADSVSEIKRTAFVQRETPTLLMGRVSALWMLQASTAPALGSLLMAFLADLRSPNYALVMGGAACVAFSALASLITMEVRGRH